MLGAIVLFLSLAAAPLTSRPAIEIEPALRRLQHNSRAPDLRSTLSRLNTDMVEQAIAAQLSMAPAAANLTVARRLSLALIGSGLSLEEIRALELVPEAEQLDWWTEYLLADERWSHYFAERFVRAWVGTQDGPFLLFRRRKLNAWLAEQFHTGVAYDKIARSLLSAEGLWTDTPQVNFVTATIEEGNRRRADPIRLAGRTSRAFLAQRIDCLQCHDDFLGKLNFGSAAQPRGGIQEDFHQLAAFFSGTALADPVFRGIIEDGRHYQFKFLDDDTEREVQPQVPFHAELLPAEGKPRGRLAQWVTHPQNHAFARATVNRVWALMFSRPLVEPVDNIPLDDSVPPMLDTLADDFAKHGFDLRRLIRIIARSDAFRRDSRAAFAITPEHEQAWCVFPLTQLRPEQVAGSLFQASKLAAIDSSSSILTRLSVFGDMQRFLRRFGDRGEDDFVEEAVTIPQRLIMMNGNLVTERTRINLINNAATRIGYLVSDNEQAVQLLSLCVLNRPPAATEIPELLAHLEDKRGQSRHRALSDIAWAMLNSTEFSWNH